MTTVDVGLIEDREALQRRTLNVLRLGVVPGQAAVAGTVAVVSLLAKDMLGSDRLAGLGSAAFTFGSAMVAIPLAAYMRRNGRRDGLALALGIGALGALVAGAGGQARWFWLFIVGMLLFGAGQSASLQARYAAADLALESERARAIGTVVWVGTLGAVFGPLFTPLEKRFGVWIGLDEYVGPYLFAAALFGVGALVYLVALRPDPLVVSGGVDPDARRVRLLTQVRVSLIEIRRSRGAVLGVVAMAVSQATMVGVMTMTPPHMADHGHADLSAMVIALHIVGMYGLAPWIGRFVGRIGAVKAVHIAAVLLGLSTITVQVAGYVPALMFIGLFLLGVGWNIGLIAGTTLLTSSVAPHARVEAQGTGDLLLSLCGATAAFGSGFVKQAFEFHILADLATMLAAGMLVYAWYTRARMAATPRTA
ncbi:MAG: MFS transporter [Ilumatobacteraceae bacterium]